MSYPHKTAKRHTTSPRAESTAFFILAVAIALAGICVISATAQWWLKR